MGGASPRKSGGGLFKAQKPRSKMTKKKLKESLKIFDFSSDSGSDGEEDEVLIKKPTKIPKATPTIQMTGETVKVKGEGSPKSKQSNTNYRCHL